MRKLIFIPILALFFYLCEYALYNWFGAIFKPNLLLLFIIFFSLSFGIRIGIYTAVVAGVIQDCFSIGIFGTNIFVNVACAYFVVLLTRYWYQRGSNIFRLQLISVMVVFHVVLTFCLHFMIVNVQLSTMIGHILVPELISTLLVTSFIFNSLKTCVLRYFA